MSDGWWVFIIMYILSALVTFLGSLFTWLEFKGGHDKEEATRAARWLAVSPIWPVGVACYLLYKTYLLFPEFINDVRGR